MPRVLQMLMSGRIPDFGHGATGPPNFGDYKDYVAASAVGVFDIDGHSTNRLSTCPQGDVIGLPDLS